MDRAETVFNAMAKWLEQASFCSCGRDQVVHFCKERLCPNHKSQIVFCYQCTSDGLHNHFPLIQITDVIRDIDVKWAQLFEKFSKIHTTAKSKYDVMKPLIKYFEAEMLKIPNIAS